MANLQKVVLGTPPDAKDGDTSRTANAKANSNVDVLNLQAALTTYPTQITANQDLPPDCVGKRVNIFNPASVGLPPASAAGPDGLVVLRNVGTVSTGIWPGGGNPTAPQAAFMTLHPGESVAFDTDGVNPWRVLLRGRAGGANETIDGALTLGSGVAGDLYATGKVSGVNKPNLQLNGSGELGPVGWTQISGSGLAITNGGDGEGTFFNNSTAVVAGTTFAANGQAIPCNEGDDFTVSGEAYAVGATAGNVYIRIAFFNSAGVALLYGPNIMAVNGQAWRYDWRTAKAPAGTTYVLSQMVADKNAVASVGGIRFRRVKVEQGTTPSLYSQEASIAYLQTSVAYLSGAPALSGRPTFAGNAPWDSGNFKPFGAYTAYQPALASSSGAWADAVAAGGYVVSGKLCFIRLELKINNIGTAVGCVLGLPFPSAVGGTGQLITGRETDVSGNMLQGFIPAGSSSCNIFKYDNTSANTNNWRLVLTGTYLIA